MSFHVKTAGSVKETTFVSAQTDGTEITAKSEGFNGQFARSLARMDLVFQTERANARKGGVESSVTRETSAEETLQSCRGDKRNSIYRT